MCYIYMSWSVSEVSKWYTLWVEFNLCNINLSRNFFYNTKPFFDILGHILCLFFLTMPFRLFYTGHSFTFVCFSLIILFLSFVLCWLDLFLSSILSWLYFSVVDFILTIYFSFLYFILVIPFFRLFYTNYIFFLSILFW
jgi:hypothetical protein